MSTPPTLRKPAAPFKPLSFPLWCAGTHPSLTGTGRQKLTFSFSIFDMYGVSDFICLES